MSDKIVFSVFSDLHWREGDWAGCERRLDAVFERAVREKSEFAIHCGDFCHDVKAARRMIEKYASGPLPAYNVMGNHEFERSDCLEDVLRAFSMERNWYSFDVRSFRFVALDNNYHRGADGRLKHYADESVWAKCHQSDMVLPPEQVDFLLERIESATGPVCVFSHASMVLPARQHGVDNGAEVVALADKARAGRPVLWFNGHHHRNRLFLRSGMAFFDVNTTTSEWTDVEHHAYPPELMAKCPTASHSLLNAVPVHAVVRLDDAGGVVIEGMRGRHYMDLSPESLGLDTTDAAGAKFDVDVLSASFSLARPAAVAGLPAIP